MISVVIPTWNRPTSLDRCLESLERQTLPVERWEVVVVDDGSDNEKTSDVAFARRLPGQVRYLRIGHSGVNSARNAGISAAKGDIICLLDDDEIAPPHWLECIEAELSRHPELAAVGGPYRGLGRPAFRTCERCGDSASVSPPADGEWLLGGNVAIRRSALEAVGLFDPELSGLGDETEWMHRARHAGLRFAASEDLFVWHHRDDQRLTDLIAKGYRQGRNAPMAWARMGVTNPRLSLWATCTYFGRSMAHLAHCVSNLCLGGLIDAAEAIGIVRGLLLVAFAGRRGRLMR